MFLDPLEWTWPLDNAIQASLLGELLTQEGIPYKIVRHGDALWGYAEQVGEGWGHLEVPDAFAEKTQDLYEAFLESFTGE
jgi:hypothetical protein